MNNFCEELKHNIYIPNYEVPYISELNFEVARKPFIHADRTVDFNVAIYLISGRMDVIEDEISYTLLPNTLFFPKSRSSSLW